MFITEDDYIQVSADALRIISQTNPANRIKAERRAMDRIRSYLGARYDMDAAFAQEGDERNCDLVGIVADMALYYMVQSLPQRMGYEIREEQYERCISFLESVQAYKADMELPAHVDDEGNEADTSAPIRVEPGIKNDYIW